MKCEVELYEHAIRSAHCATQIEMEALEEAITLSWKSLTVKAPAPPSSLMERFVKKQESTPCQRNRTILNGVSGSVCPGQMIAIVGSSGAGKTTLLNVLARQNTARLKVSGFIHVNGKNIGNRIKDISAYVQQEEFFIGTLTVKEHLTFQAMLRMGNRYTTAHKLKRVNLVLREMGLRKCAHTVIGIPGRLKGISGGEKTRLSFASEILTNPSVLFVDEPTTGLDAFMAEMVVKVLQDMAMSGRTILCTIHQPSSQIFNMFGSLLLLAEGQTAYLGATSDALAYFQRLGYACPENYNPADFYVHALAIVPGREDECKLRVKEICDTFNLHSQTSTASNEIGHHNCDESEMEFTVKEGSGFKASLFSQLCLLLWRSWLIQSRDPSLLRIKFLQSIFVALLMGLIYFDIADDEHRLQNISGVLFFVCINNTLINMFAVIQTFPSEMPVMLREHGSRLYRIELYYLTKHLSDLPVVVFQTFIYSIVIYWMVGLQQSMDKFLVFYGVLITIANIALGCGYIVSAVAPNVSVGLAIGPLFVIPMMVFGGHVVNIESIPVYFYWISYVSWFYYGFEVLSVNEWAGVTGGNCPFNTVIGCRPNGTGALKFFALKESNYYRDLGILVALLIGAKVIGLILLKIRVYRHENHS
ncbi:protein white-like [Corticium candelabrum]|uniref:protein white-like n=1 Tax=Corticium candelabrum TaxID=121492 RepID=UPI002E26354E|nr:protein white-like [Corticium candelabrum]